MKRVFTTVRTCSNQLDWSVQFYGFIVYSWVYYDPVIFGGGLYGFGDGGEILDGGRGEG